jgi:hypothetical protein
MTKTYQIHGAGCDGCLKKISFVLIHLPEVEHIISIDTDSIVIRFKEYLEYVDIDILNQAFADGNYWLTEMPHVINFELVPDPFFEKI